MSRPWTRRIAACLLVLATGAAALAQDAVWNLRTPEWKDAWTRLSEVADPDLALIRIASQLVAYSGSFLPVAPVAPGMTAGLEPGQVPVDLAWFEAPPGILAFGVASGWAHRLQQHAPLAEPASAQDVATWMAEVRYGREDTAAADAWAARFMAEFGHPVEPLLARLCERGEGARVAAIADAYQAVVGWRPQAPCGPEPVVVAAPALPMTCDEAFAACRSDAEAQSLVCNGGCGTGQCALACSSGSYEQCSACQATCGRACNSTAALAWDVCGEALETCRATE